MKYPFSLRNEDDIILVNGLINDNGILLALDTAATQTVIDLNTLLIMGYKISDASEIVYLETSNGVIEARRIHAEIFSALGTEHSNYELFTYDFLLSGITSPYDGLLGLDFFKDKILTIDFRNQELWVETT